MLACALSSNTKVTFIIDWRYFRLADLQFYHVYEQFRFIDSLYPHHHELNNSRKDYRILNILDRPRDFVFEKLYPNCLVMSVPFHRESPIIDNSKRYLFKIAHTRSLRIAFPVNAVKSKSIYKLLFK